jgi:hypothetical protein
MRNLLVLSTAASVLALGISAHQAAATFPGTDAISPEKSVLKIQKSDEKGPGTRGQDAGGKAADPGGRGGSGKGVGASQDKGDRAQMRSGDKGARGGQQGTNVDVNVDRGRRGDRAGRRTSVDVDVDRGRRRSGRDVDVNVRGYGAGYGYTRGGSSCQEILRRYRQCIAR